MFITVKGAPFTTTNTIICENTANERIVQVDEYRIMCSEYHSSNVHIAKVKNFCNSTRTLGILLIMYNEIESMELEKAWIPNSCVNTIRVMDRHISATIGYHEEWIMQVFFDELMRQLTLAHDDITTFKCTLFTDTLKKIRTIVKRETGRSVQFATSSIASQIDAIFEDMIFNYIRSCHRI